MPLPATFPIFPLPSVLLVPGGFLPLHIFEPRYRDMVSDALEGDRALGMAMPLVLRAGDDPQRPRIHPVVGLGRIVHRRLHPDGRSDIVIAGLARMRIVEEIETDRPYRRVRARELPDVVTPGEDLAERAAALLARLRDVESADRERIAALPPGRLVDSVLVRTSLAVREKHRIHAIPEVAVRMAEVERAMARAEGVVYPGEIGPGDPRLN